MAIIHKSIKRRGRAAAVKADSREPATQVPEGTGQVSRPAVIEVRGLRKSYGDLDAVAGIDLTVCAGEVFAFLGPNGAGKTTTVEILEGYRRRTAGDVSVPLCFISGIFIPSSELPHWLADIGYVFPVHSLAAALLAAYNPHTTGSGLSWGYLAILAAWGIAGLVIAIRRFSWLPRGG